MPTRKRRAKKVVGRVTGKVIEIPRGQCRTFKGRIRVCLDRRGRVRMSGAKRRRKRK